MELVGIALSIPVAFLMSMGYCLVAGKVLRNREPLRVLLLRASWPVLGCLLVELALLASLGAVRSRGILGPGFYVAHLLLFFLGTPALANLLVLPRKDWLLGRWYVAGLLCTLLAVFLVFLQIGVSEALYGVEGKTGPYS